MDNKTVVVPVKKLADLLLWATSQVCQHEETHRGGVLWEICGHCGAKWADDEGGKPEFKYPAIVEEMYELIEAPQAEQPQEHDYETSHAIMEAERNTAVEEYIKARPQLDSIHNRRIFEAGFQRGFECKPSALSAPAQAQDVTLGVLLEDSGLENFIKDGDLAHMMAVQKFAALVKASHTAQVQDEREAANAKWDSRGLAGSLVGHRACYVQGWLDRADLTAPQDAQLESERDRTIRHMKVSGELAAQVNDLSMLMCRMVHALNHASPGNPIAKKAADYLKRNDLQGSPLRTEDVLRTTAQPADSKQDAQERDARVLEGCDCGFNLPVASDPIEMLEFLAERFEQAGVSKAVGEIYAHDIRKILAEQPAEPIFDMRRMEEAFASGTIVMPAGLSRDEKIAFIEKHAVPANKQEGNAEQSKCSDGGLCGAGGYCGECKAGQQAGEEK